MASKKLSVLVVDDEPMLCDLLSEALTGLGYECATTLSGDDALAHLSVRKFDVVLLDIKMPRMSGMDVLQQMRINYSNTAIIMMTGVNDADTAVQAIKLGASDYIVKPFELEKLEQRIHTVLETRPTKKKSLALKSPKS